MRAKCHCDTAPHDTNTEGDSSMSYFTLSDGQKLYYEDRGNGPFNLNVAAAVCTAFGQSVPAGTLPVNVPEITVNGEDIVFEEEYLYQRGFGLKNWGK